MHSLGIVQWDSIRRDHPGYPGRVSGSGPVKSSLDSIWMMGKSVKDSNTPI